MEIRNYKPTMRYRPFGARTNVLVSMLGIGAMRLPLTPEGAIDETRANELIETGLEGGINYIDTAYVYNDGASEMIVGDTLQRGWRDKIYVATKMPVWELEKPGDQEPFLRTQLERLRMDQIDFYLLHSLNARYWQNVLRSDSLAWLDEEKRRRIRFAGFRFMTISTYSKQSSTLRLGFLPDPVQLRANIRAGTRGLQYAHSKGIAFDHGAPLRRLRPTANTRREPIV